MSTVASATRSSRLLVNPDATAQVRGWLRAGLADLKARPAKALLYGLIVTGLGWAALAALFVSGLGWMILPALGGMLLLLPLLSAGLFLMVREGGERPSSQNWTQLMVLGTCLMVLQMAWLRAATISFALVFGLKPFPGPTESLIYLVSMPEGWVMLFLGSALGGLFAAFGFAVTAFSVPLVLDRKIDAFSAMGTSFSTVTHNLPVTLRWAAVITGLYIVSVVTGGLLFVAIFPYLGFCTWRAYRDMID